MARAQSTSAGGDGIKVGDGRLHPSVQADTHYVTDPGYTTNSPDDMVLVIRPGLDFELPSDKLDLKFLGDVEYQRYLGVRSASTRDYSTFAGRAGLTSVINKKSALQLRLHETLTRDADPGQVAVGKRLLHVVNDVGLGAEFRPGGGALIFSADYSFFLDRYDRSDNDVAVPAYLDNMRHNPRLRVAWKFLPKTAIFLEAEGYITRFYGKADPPSPPNPNVGSNLLLAYLGAAGSITSRISALLKAGYGNTFIPGSDNFNSAVGQAEVNYAFTETTGFKGGIARTAQPTSVFKYFTLNRAYLTYSQAFSGRIQTGLTLAYDYITFGSAVLGTDRSPRTDGNLVGEATFAYQVTDLVTVSLADRVNLLDSTYRADPSQIKINYRHNDLFLRVSFRY
ncbi:MAG: outer membrane beta-barrel protein [Deltaproteobacteria bacterium]|nr:outer membrane beta-barrel protein [Deltaproteobacteria bacterium]